MSQLFKYCCWISKVILWDTLFCQLLSYGCDAIWQIVVKIFTTREPIDEIHVIPLESELQALWEEYGQLICRSYLKYAQFLLKYALVQTTWLFAKILITYFDAILNPFWHDIRIMLQYFRTNAYILEVCHQN